MCASAVAAVVAIVTLPSIVVFAVVALSSNATVFAVALSVKSLDGLVALILKLLVFVLLRYYQNPFACLRHERQNHQRRFLRWFLPTLPPPVMPLPLLPSFLPPLRYPPQRPHSSAFAIVASMISISLCNCSACVGVGSMGTTSLSGEIADNTFIVVEADIIMRSAVVPSAAKSTPLIVIVISPAYTKGSGGNWNYVSTIRKQVCRQ